MPQSRRTHTKSRGGCLECKRRKIKCNEEKPICSGCKKRVLPCEYPSPGSSPRGTDSLRPILRSGPSSASSPQRSTPSITPASNNEGPPLLAPFPTREGSSPLVDAKSLGHFNMEDMALWHQFVTKTAITIAWAVEAEVSLLALSCDYLMHAVLSTAALHLAYQNPDQRDRYKYLATQHQDLALGPFRSAMTNITAENCHQVFAFSILLVVSQYASSRSANFLLPAPEVSSGLTNWIICLRGCSSIVRASCQHIRSGPLARLVDQENRADILTAGGRLLKQDEDSQSLDKLAHYLTNLPTLKSVTTVTEMESFADAIALLQKLLAASSQVSDSLSRRSLSSMWPVKVSDTFVRLLGEHRPPALAIMAHYCLLLKRCHSCWYMEHRAYDLFAAIHQNLAEEWMPCIEHPIQVFRGQ